MSRGVASSLALLASIMILTTQICISLTFAEIVSEEVMKRIRGMAEEEGLKILSLAVAVNGSSLVIVNGREDDLSLISLSLYHIDGRIVDIEVNWSIAGRSVGIYQVPEPLDVFATCIAVKLTLREGSELLLPLSRV